MTLTKVALFWIGAASAVGVAHAQLDPLSPAGGAVAAIAIIIAAAWGYMELCAPHGSVSHAVGVGVAWVVLGIVTELAVTMRGGRGWYAILGTPDRPLLRDVFLFVWIFAPALFARTGEES